MVVSLRDSCVPLHVALRDGSPLCGGVLVQSQSLFNQPVLMVFMKRTYSPARTVQRFAPTTSPALVVELLALLFLSVMLSACTSSKQLALEPPFPEPQPERVATIDHPVPDVEYRLRSEVAVWAGAPHELGGTTLRGIDCSAFVQKVYERAFSLQIPRTTREQLHAGTRVQRRDLRPGDLVFFNPPTKTRHVGIYLNDGEFAHASSSQGVTISELDQEYWDQSYLTSRRILPESERPVIADRTRVIGDGPLPYPPQDFEMEEPKRDRIGW